MPIDFTQIETGEDFELLCEALLRAMGFTIVQKVARGPDQGKDIVASKLVTDETLAGSREKEMWISPSDDIYVLAVLDTAQIKDSVRSQVISGYRQDSTKWQQFEAQNGNAELDAEIEKVFRDGH